VLMPTSAGSGLRLEGGLGARSILGTDSPAAPKPLDTSTRVFGPPRYGPPQ